MHQIFLVLILTVIARSEPQLDIPGSQHSTESPRQNGLRVLVVPNSYANESPNEQPKSEANTPYDQDRSQRYGTELKKF
jgi:hypothetical protein